MILCRFKRHPGVLITIDKREMLGITGYHQMWWGASCSQGKPTQVIKIDARGVRHVTELPVRLGELNAVGLEKLLTALLFDLDERRQLNALRRVSG